MSNTRIVTKPVLIAVEGKNVCRFLKNRMDKTPQQFDKIDLMGP